MLYSCQQGNYYSSFIPISKKYCSCYISKSIILVLFQNGSFILGPSLQSMIKESPILVFSSTLGCWDYIQIVARSQDLVTTWHSPSHTCVCVCIYIYIYIYINIHIYIYQSPRSSVGIKTSQNQSPKIFAYLTQATLQTGTSLWSLWFVQYRICLHTTYYIANGSLIN